MKQKPPNIIPVLVLTLLTAVTWISFSVYRALTSKPEAVVSGEIAQPFEATLDKAVIEKVKGRTFLDEGQIPTTTFSILPAGSTPTPSTQPANITLPSPVPETTSTATPAGTITE
jgi:hypothetical protein